MSKSFSSLDIETGLINLESLSHLLGALGLSDDVMPCVSLLPIKDALDQYRAELREVYEAARIYEAAHMRERAEV